MEFDDIIKKRLSELEEFFRKMVEDSDKFSEIREFLSDNGYNAILCLMTLVYRANEAENDEFDEEFFEEEIDEELEKDFSDSVCENDKLFLKKIQNSLDY